MVEVALSKLDISTCAYPCQPLIRGRQKLALQRVRDPQLVLEVEGGCLYGVRVIV
jgi:hypothetical protein